MLTTIPRELRENLARTRGYLRRDELPRALETLSAALRQSAGMQLLRPARAEWEIHVTDVLNELARHPGMQPLLDPEGSGAPRPLPYQKNKEGLLASVLEGLGKILQDAAAQRQRAAQDTEEQRKRELMDTGVLRLTEGELSRGRAFLKRAAAEFGHQPGVYLEVGQRLAAHGQFIDAAEIFEKSMEVFPREAEAYAGAVDAYTRALEFAKAEAAYVRILRQFGGHPRTYGKMAQMYLAWQKRAKAEEFALRALQADPEQAEALVVMRRLHH